MNIFVKYFYKRKSSISLMRDVLYVWVSTMLCIGTYVEPVTQILSVGHSRSSL